jgi:hypothetical protein
MIVTSIIAVLGIITTVAGAGIQKDYPIASQVLYGGGLATACLGSFALGVELVAAGYIQIDSP